MATVRHLGFFLLSHLLRKKWNFVETLHMDSSELLYASLKMIFSLSTNMATTVLSTSLGKTVFAWRFILNENILFWLTISNQKPFVFFVSVFCSQIFTVKLNLRPKISLTYAISIVKWFFGVFVWENILYFSLLNLNYWCFTTIVWKFKKNWTSGTCWKSASKLPTLQISAKFTFIFTIGKSENIWFFKIQWIE